MNIYMTGEENDVLLIHVTAY